MAEVGAEAPPPPFSLARSIWNFAHPRAPKLSGVLSIISWTLLASLLIFGSFARKRRDHESIANRRDAAN
jgi:hypothetical protein